MTMRACGLSALLFTAACVGAIEPGFIGGTSPDEAPLAPLAENVPVAAACRGKPGPSPLRRLTRGEYDDTVQVLLGDASRPATRFTEDAHLLGFDNIAAAQSVSNLLAEQYEDAADGLATAAVRNLAGLIGCDPASADHVCLQGFVKGFGRRAYRRPLEAQQIDRYVAFLEDQRARFDLKTATRLLVKAMLMSPYFLYRVELAPALTSYEMASRLSYLFWGTMPDDVLFQEADAGRLVTAAQVATQAKRLLADPRAGRAVGHFFTLWLEVDRLAGADKDPNVYPQFTAAIPSLLVEEVQRLAQDLVLTRGGGFATLLTAQHSYLDKTLAAFYKVSGPTGSTFTEVRFDPRKRAGLLSAAGVLAVQAVSNQTHPIKRGVFVREQLLCQALTPPPGELKVTLPEPDPGSTGRARIAALTAPAFCAACHALINPVGFGFENYDGIGLWRDKDNGQAIDSSGEVVGTLDANGPFTGVTELAQRLSGSKEAQGCFATQWFRYAQGRSETAADDCARARLGAALQNGGTVQDMLVTLTQTDAFLGAGGPP
jgi:hypothetical protein